MRYTKKVIDLIKANKQLRLRLALELNITEQAVNKAIKKNSSTLQRYAAVVLIKQFIRLPESEMFEKTKQQPA